MESPFNLICAETCGERECYQQCIDERVQDACEQETQECKEHRAYVEWYDNVWKKEWAARATPFTADDSDPVPF